MRSKVLAWAAALKGGPEVSLLCCSKLQDDALTCALASRVRAFPASAAAPVAAAREAAPAEIGWPLELAAFVPASVQTVDL